MCASVLPSFSHGVKVPGADVILQDGPGHGDHVLIKVSSSKSSQRFSVAG